MTWKGQGIKSDVNHLDLWEQMWNWLEQNQWNGIWEMEENCCLLVVCIFLQCLYMHVHLLHNVSVVPHHHHSARSHAEMWPWSNTRARQICTSNNDPTFLSSSIQWIFWWSVNLICRMYNCVVVYPIDFIWHLNILKGKKPLIWWFWMCDSWRGWRGTHTRFEAPLQINLCCCSVSGLALQFPSCVIHTHSFNTFASESMMRICGNSCISKM